MVTRAGEAEQTFGWPAAVFDLVARRHGRRLRRLPDPESARARLVAQMLAVAGELSAGDAAAALGLARVESARILDLLVDQGLARRHDERGAALWTAPRG